MSIFLPPQLVQEDIMKSVSINFRLTIIPSFLVLLAIFAGTFSQKAHADLAVVAQGQVVNQATRQVFPVWVTYKRTGYEMIVSLGTSSQDEKAFMDQARSFQQAVKEPGCQAVGEELQGLKRLVLFSFVCAGEARPDTKVRYAPKVGSSAKPQSHLRPALYYINLHRGFRVQLT